MKKLIVICALLLVSSCTLYHKKHGRVSVFNENLQESSAECILQVKKEKRYKNRKQYQDMLGICMMEKGWRP